MNFRQFSTSQAYFEIAEHLLHCNRFAVVKVFLEVLATIPFAIMWKLGATLLKGVGVLCAGCFLGVTLGVFKGIREVFVKQATCFAANLADWVIFPFAVLICLFRLFLGCLIHPSFFLRY